MNICVPVCVTLHRKLQHRKLRRTKDVTKKRNRNENPEKERERQRAKNRVGGGFEGRSRKFHFISWEKRLHPVRVGGWRCGGTATNRIE